MNENKYWIWLTLVFGIGSRRIWQLVNMFDSPEAIYYALKNGRSGIIFNQREINNIKRNDISFAEHIIKVCELNNIGIVAYDSETYPEQLKNLSIPPAVIYYKGNIRCVLGTPTVTVVGTRNASDYSLRTTVRVCREIAEKGIVIVSGFAVGTDITAHLAAVETGRPTACVMGCGLDVDYPRANFGYRSKVIETGGVFISEYLPGTPARGSNFHRRNRILAALGRIAVIFQAPEHSGSLITAGLAAELGRDVFVLPPADIADYAYKGNSMLIHDGASVLLGSENITEIFEASSPMYDRINKESMDILMNSGEDLLEGNLTDTIDTVSEDRLMRAASYIDKHKLKYSETSAEVSAVDNEIHLNGVQRDIVEILKDGDADTDEIALKMNMDASEIATELTEMEMTGAIKALPGKRFSIGKYK